MYICICMYYTHIYIYIFFDDLDVFLGLRSIDVWYLLMPFRPVIYCMLIYTILMCLYHQFDKTNRDGRRWHALKFNRDALCAMSGDSATATPSGSDSSNDSEKVLKRSPLPVSVRLLSQEIDGNCTDWNGGAAGEALERCWSWGTGHGLEHPGQRQAIPAQGRCSIRPSTHVSMPELWRVGHQIWFFW